MPISLNWWGLAAAMRSSFEALRRACQAAVRAAAQAWSICRPLLILFLITRILYAWAGVSFDAAPIDYYWQIADTELLKTQLWETVTHLHSQAPLFNLFIGAGLKLFGEQSTYWFHLCYSAMTFGFLVTIDRTLSLLRISPPIRWAVALFLFTNPSLVLYENHLFYEIPTVFLVSLAVYAFARHMADPRRGLWLFFTTTALLCLLQASFHLLWFVLGAVLIGLWGKAGIWRLLRAGALPFLVVAAVYGLHYQLFGGFSLSPAHLGPNLRQHTCGKLTRAERRKLVADGTLSKVANLSMFSPVRRVSRLVPVEKTGIPILDNPKRKNGRTNYHHLVYLEESKMAMKDVKTVIKLRPELYPEAIRAGFMKWFFRPIDQSVPVPGAKNINAIKPFWLRYAKTVYRQDEPQQSLSKLYVVFVPLALVCGLIVFFVALWRSNRAIAGFIFYCAFMFSSGALPQIFVAISDLNRYRFRVECCLLFMLLLAVQGGYNLLARRWRAYRESTNIVVSSAPSPENLRLALSVSRV